MNISKTFMAALGLIVAACTVVAFLPDHAFAAAGHPAASPALAVAGDIFQHLAGNAVEYMAIPVAVMRANLKELEQRAKAKEAEIKDDTPADQVESIRTEHRSLVEEIEQLRSDIAAAEEAAAAETDPPAPVAGQQAEGAGDDVEGRVQRALAGERSRVAEIQSLATRHGLGEAFVAQHTSAGSDIATVRTAVLDELATRGDRNPVFPHVELGGLDETTSRREGMRDALAARLARAGGNRSVQVPEHARQWAERDIAEIAAECINWRGSLRTGRQVTEMFQRAFHTTSDFPGIFTDAMNVRLLDRYEAAAPTYRLFSARMTTPDFKAMNVIRAGDFPALQPVTESGEIKGGTFGESKEVVQTKPYGVQLRITRQMLINDQLGAIEQMLGSYGVRVADWENDLVFSVLLSASGAGPTLLTDNKAVFHTGHGNLTGTGTAITVASIGIGRAMMAKQKSLDGIKLNLKPKTILCGPDSITSAEQLVATITPSAPGNAVPESMRNLMPASDASIPDYAWYLFADPEVAPVFVYSNLEGFEGPRLTAEDTFDVQGMKVKLEHDFGAGASDYRGAYRNAGAAPV
ncbi:hypothetical protein [Microbaculum marinisediminis]|uniref:Mu-like prophage major head subunit gpT n=1 Tax=Microbaculum marinisediminis TaxID=2931392 RepID=A0AAW5QRJ4_9HYPH|nr:hypothetical protein [Microbaculum sp. A6E488]MCT8970590.1 hypothetical protein [Microbaculum sp. A6E488]